MMPWSQTKKLASLVKLSHTVFGLPFTLASALLAHRAATQVGEQGLTLAKTALILGAFTCARTAAMAWNRIVDVRFDGHNPRTRDRELVQGVVSMRAAYALTAAALSGFVLCAALLGPWPLLLSPVCVAVIMGYSLFKRFSWTSHLALGLGLALGPGGAWIAVRGSFAGWLTPLWLMIAVATWVGGFDILYSLQDREFDGKNGLHSIPVRFGVRGALVFSAALHGVTAAALVAVHVREGLGVCHALGIGSIAALLVYEHWIVRPSDLSRINRAFFDLNGYISLVYFACLALSLL